ncbi:MAG: response regulator [Desulfobacterales bacterium]|nr:response regulator [Desulfobacterales bacterium]
MSVKILTVDDSKTVRMIVKRTFKPFACEILEAGSGEEGLATAARETPDLVILDITMAGMSGLEVLEEMKQTPALETIPVIMLTAERGNQYMVRAVKLGIKDYLHKPFKPEQLIESAGRVVDLK